MVRRRTSARRCSSSRCSPRCSTSPPSAGRTSSSRSACSSRGAFVAYQLFAHVQDRVDIVDRPVVGVADARASSSCSRCSRSAVGGFAGTGLGLGSPQKIPERDDRLHASRPSVRSSGCSARSRSSSLFLLLVGSGFRIAIQADRPFSKLFAAGLTTILGVQTFVIIGGVTRRDPAHRRDAAVRLVRRLVARRELRDHRPAAAHLRRDSRARKRPARSADRAAPRREVTPRPRAAGAPVNRPIRRVGNAVTVLILLLVAQLTYLQVVDANNLANDPRNVRSAAQGVQPGRAARSSPPTARSSPGRSRRRATSSTCASTRRASCSRRSSATSRSSTWSAAPASRSRTTTCSPARTPSLQLSDLGDLLSGKAADQQRRALAHRVARSRSPRPRSATRRARSSRST